MNGKLNGKIKQKGNFSFVFLFFLIVLIQNVIIISDWYHKELKNQIE